MGFPDSDWVKIFCVGKEITDVKINDKFPTEMMDIVFSDGTVLQLTAIDKNNCFSHKANLLVTPRNNIGDVIQSTTILRAV